MNEDRTEEKSVYILLFN